MNILNTINEFIHSCFPQFYHHSPVLSILMLLLFIIHQILRFKLVPLEKNKLQGLNFNRKLELILRAIIQILLGLPVYSAPLTQGDNDTNEENKQIDQAKVSNEDAKYKDNKTIKLKAHFI